ncbi:MAG: hypothetical protein O3B84_01895 [Chloroflexi bacterium]|nr:hypothetical protein [Chloroflexota bacterium]
MNACICHIGDDGLADCDGSFEHSLTVDASGQVVWSSGSPPNLEGRVTVVIPLVSEDFASIEAAAQRLASAVSDLSARFEAGMVSLVVAAGLVVENESEAGLLLDILRQTPSLNVVVMATRYCNGDPLREYTAGTSEDLRFGIRLMLRALGNNPQLLKEAVVPSEYRERHDGKSAARSLGLRILCCGTDPVLLTARCACMDAGLKDILGSSQTDGWQIEERGILQGVADVERIACDIVVPRPIPVFDSQPEWCLASSTAIREAFLAEVSKCASEIAALRETVGDQARERIAQLATGSAVSDIFRDLFRTALLNEAAHLHTATDMVERLEKQAADRLDQAQIGWQAQEDAGLTAEEPPAADMTELREKVADVLDRRPSLSIFYGLTLAGLLLGLCVGVGFWRLRPVLVTSGFSIQHWLAFGAGFGALAHMIIWTWLGPPPKWLRDWLFPSRKTRMRRLFRRLSLIAFIAAGAYASFRLADIIVRSPFLARVLIAVSLVMLLTTMGGVVGFGHFVRRWLRWKRLHFDPLLKNAEDTVRKNGQAWAAFVKDRKVRLDAYARVRALQSLRSVVRIAGRRLTALTARIHELRSALRHKHDETWETMRKRAENGQIRTYAFDSRVLPHWERIEARLAQERTSSRSAWCKARDLIPSYVTEVNASVEHVVHAIRNCLDTEVGAEHFNVERMAIPQDGLPIREGYGVNTTFRRGAEAVGNEFLFHVRNPKSDVQGFPEQPPPYWGTQYQADGEFLMAWGLLDRWLPLSVWAEEQDRMKREIEERSHG